MVRVINAFLRDDARSKVARVGALVALLAVLPMVAIWFRRLDTVTRAAIAVSCMWMFLLGALLMRWRGC